MTCIFLSLNCASISKYYEYCILMLSTILFIKDLDSLAVVICGQTLDPILYVPSESTPKILHIRVTVEISKVGTITVIIY